MTAKVAWYSMLDYADPDTYVAMAAAQNRYGVGYSQGDGAYVSVDGVTWTGPVSRDGEGAKLVRLARVKP